MGKRDRKYIKTKFEGVFYRLSARRDPRTGELDRVYCFWYADAQGKGHWKTVGRHSGGERPATARQARAKLLTILAGGADPVQQEKYTVSEAVNTYLEWARGGGGERHPLRAGYAHKRKRPLSSLAEGNGKLYGYPLPAGDCGRSL